METTPGLGRVCCIVAWLALTSLPLCAGDDVPAGWFKWPSVEPRAGSAPDVSGLNDAPAGSHGRIAVKDGHFVAGDGTRIRFWGANLTSGDAFPDAAHARSFARWLAKGGVNIARLHHLDNPWGADSGGSIWPRNTKQHLALDPDQLKKLHRLIAELKANGIYVNVNLKVSKQLSEADGFPASVREFKDFQKRVDFYDRHMIDLQKDYARRLLTAKNPYTGFTLVDDPAVAVIEINNENSLLGYWTRDLGRGIDKFPEPFRGELTTMWNAWLDRHYSDDARLTNAWYGGPEPARTVVINSTARLEMKEREGASLKLIADPGAPGVWQFQSVAPTGLEWHAQATLGGVALVDGEAYTVTFEARADHERSIVVGLGLDPDSAPGESWRSVGLFESVGLSTDWKQYRYSFSAQSLGSAKARLGLGFGTSSGTVWIKDFELQSGRDRNALPDGQSLATHTVAIPSAASGTEWNDWISFLADRDLAYATEMRTYLRNELHVKAPIVCTQIEYGGLIGLNRERDSDFADSHHYWQHPVFFGGKSWDSANWKVTGTPEIAELGSRMFGDIGGLALNRVTGKPFTVSEFDHPAPSDFVCEMYPLVSSFAAIQDWDGIYPFCIADYGPKDRDGAIKGYFDQNHHPAKWGQAPFAAMVFRRGLIASAGAEFTLRLGDPLWGEAQQADIVWKKLLPDAPIDFLHTRFDVSDQPLPAGGKAEIERSGASHQAPVALVTAPQGNVYVISDEQAAAAVGFIGGATVDAGAMTVSCDRFGRDFASVTAASLDGKSLSASKRVLVTIVGRAENQAMGWNADRTSVGNNWGHGPTMVEHVPAHIMLAVDSGRTVYALAPDGSQAATIPAKTANGMLSFDVGANDRTIFYEIVK